MKHRTGHAFKRSESYYCQWRVEGQTFVKRNGSEVVKESDRRVRVRVRVRVLRTLARTRTRKSPHSVILSQLLTHGEAFLR